MYQGSQVDVTGKRTPEKGLAKRVVMDLVAPFAGLNHVLYCDNFYSSGPLADSLAKEQIFIVGTIKKCSRGFPENLKTAKPPAGGYVSEKVGENRYFVFQDRKQVCFITNVFPEHMDSKVLRMQPGGVLRAQSVPPLLPAYNKYMGGVDRTDQLRKSYGFDRKSKRSWLCLFVQFFDYAINNAYLLKKHDCTQHEVKCEDLLEFRMQLVHLLLEDVGRQRSLPCSTGTVQSPSVCYLVQRLTHWGRETQICVIT